ncbi:MAG TPA: hypothetical protein DHW02_09095 [Ktedonobacter sp.]|nr:hypothetical protein [Ktedonobacter sp.]
MIEAKDIFEDAMEWLKDHYGNWCFFTERDIVWVLQNHLISLIRGKSLPYRLFYNFEMYPENKKGKNKKLYQGSDAKNKESMAADLVIFNDDKKIVEVAIELKYEPSHQRKYNPKAKIAMQPDIEPTAIMHGKYPVAFFTKRQAGNGGSGEEDIERVI